MKKRVLILLSVIFFACNSNEQKNNQDKTDDILTTNKDSSLSYLYDKTNQISQSQNKDNQSSDKLEDVKADLSTYKTNLELIRGEKNITITDIPRIRTLLEDAQDFYRIYDTSTDTIYKPIRKNLNQFKTELIKTQKYIYPLLRKAFAKHLKNGLWEEDIKVEHSGTTISFIGYQYATNRNIKESYEGISDALSKLRFKQVNFKWSSYGEYTYYTIPSPLDSEVI